MSLVLRLPRPRPRLCPASRPRYLRRVRPGRAALRTQPVDPADAGTDADPRGAEGARQGRPAHHPSDARHVRAAYVVRRSARDPRIAARAGRHGGLSRGDAWTDRRLAALCERAAQDPAEHDSDVEDAQHAGWAFHDEMFRATGNDRLAQAYDNLRAQSGLALQKMRQYSVERTRQAVGEHLDIYAAIETGTPTPRSSACGDICRRFRRAPHGAGAIRAQYPGQGDHQA